MEKNNYGDKKNKRKPNIDLSTMVYGKVPPQSKNIEEAILGEMLINSGCVNEVKFLLSASDFYVDAHQRICNCIYEVSEVNKVEMLLVVEKLKEKEELDIVGGPYAIVKLTNQVTGEANINLKKYCLIVKEKSIKRRLIEFAGVIISDAYEDNEDVFDLLLNAELKLKGVNTELDEMNITPISSIAMNVISSFEEKVFNARNNIKDENDVYTGFKDWDELNGRLFPGLYIVAGRPGMGKGVHMTECACRMGKMFDVGIINGEMTDEQLLTRIGCNLLGIDNFLFKKNPSFITDEEKDKVSEAMNEALNLKIHIENNRYIHKIANKIKIWVERENVKVILADFLSLFKVNEDLSRYFTDTQRINYILDVFVSLCKDLKIPIILYVQMNRQILGRSGVKEPNMSDLKQSGNIEELAYQVSFLHRPEYYDENEIQDDMGESTKGLCYQIIAKHRDGKLGRLKLRANLPSSQMKEWEDDNLSNSYKNIKDNPF
jgi:replicative DNA helicase